MSDNSKKYILNLIESPISEVISTIIENLQYSVMTSIEEGISYEFVLIDSDKQEITVDSKVIYFGELEDKKSFFEKNGVAILSNDIISSDTEQTYFKRLLGENSSLDTADSLETELRALGKVKVTDHFNSGFYSDSISTKAAEEGFDFFKVKSGIFSLFGLTSELILDDKGDFPIDVEFGVSEDNFFIQSHFPVKDFYAEIIWNLLSKTNHPFSLLIDSAKVIDIYSLEKTNKLVVTASWSKVQSESKALFIHGIDEFRFANREISLKDTKSLKINHEDDPKIDLTEVRQSKLTLASTARVVSFLKKHINDPSEVTISNITEHLNNYPNKVLISGLNSSDKEKIIKVLADSSKQSHIKQSIDSKKESFSEDLLEKFLTKVQNLDIEEANEIVSLGVEDHTESIQRVSGWVDSVDESSMLIRGIQEDIGEKGQIVKGHKENLDESSTVIKGTREDLGTDNQKLEVKSLGGGSTGSTEVPKWRMAKDSLVTQIRERISRNEIGSHTDLEEQFSNILQDQMNISEEESKALTEGILNESASGSLEFQNSNPDPISDEQSKLKDAAARKDIQISRMMKLIDAMKKELLVKSSNSTSETKLENNVEVLALKKELDKKNKQIEILKVNTGRLAADHQSEKEKNLSDIQLVKEEESVEVKSYEAKIKVLESIVKEAKERSEILNTRLEEERENFTARSESETIQFREKMMKSQKIINTFQKENKELLSEVESLKNTQNELNVEASEKSAEVNSELITEKEEELNLLNLELKKEENQSKALALKIKQLEQKNKFLLAQVDESKKNKNISKNGGNGLGDPKVQHKIKQLEKLIANFKSESENAKLELGEKKKEILKFKQEANLLKLKVTEYERKIAINKKQAA